MTILGDPATAQVPDLPIADQPMPSVFDRVRASTAANDIQNDRNLTRAGTEAEMLEELFEALGPNFQAQTYTMASGRPYQLNTQVRLRREAALRAVAEQRALAGGRAPSLEGLPTTGEEFEAWVNTRQREDWEAAQEVLGYAPEGAWAPELAGVLWSEVSDREALGSAVASAPFAPFRAASAGARVARVAGFEGVVGAVTAGAQLEAERISAERLLLPEPNAAEQMLFGALGGAVLGGGLQAGAEGLSRGFAALRNQALADQAAEAPAGRSPLETDNAIADAAAMLANDPVTEQAFGIRTNPNMNPMLTLDGRQSAMTRPEAGANMEAVLAGPFARMQEIFGAEVTINDAIARAGTSRESQTPGSRHFHGDALDLDISGMSAEDQLRLVNAAIEAGFTGFGFGRGILHVDMGQRRSWAYGNTTFAGRPISEMAQLVASGRAAEPDFDAIARTIVGAESGGNPNARNGSSSATGLGQFIESTWLGMIERHRPDLMEGRTRAQILALRTDPDVSMEMTVAYTRDNAAALDQAGFPPTPGNLYLAHFAGPEGAIAALGAPRDAPILTVMSRQAIAANAPIRYQGRRFADFTVGHLIGWARSRMGDTGAAGGATRAASPAGAGTSGGAASGVWTPTSRGYTTTGQITTGVRTIDVQYEVVDAASLRAASGALQPRDRSRAASAEQIGEMAARLDPARLMPAPEADRGAPIVGPDGIIESGNGRVAAIREAATRFPDRIAAYRSAIREAGFDVPDDMEVPVLVARRRSDLSDADRQLFVREANSATVARMSASERAAMDASMIDEATMARFDPAAALDTPENAGFLRAALARLPQAERGALVTPEGRLNREGRERMNRAIFARAFDDRELLERLAEEQPGELRSLLEALEQAAPSWAALRADIAAGRVAPEFDIGGHVIEAVRIIAAARDIARTSGKAVQGIIDELLADNDLLEGMLSPLTQALVRKMYPEGRVLAADKVADFLRRYADEARKIGQGGGLLDAPGPLDALRAIDPQTFGGLTETGTPRGQGAARSQAGSPVRVERLADMPDQEADTLIFQIQAAQNFRDVDEIMARGAVNHEQLTDEIRRAAERAGVTQRKAPLKGRDRVEEKLRDKYRGNLNMIGDVARGGVDAESLEAADAFVTALARRYRVIDEGWNVTDAGYFDRKLTVVFDDDQIGEVQIWPPGMFEAKEKRGGHDLYKISRDLEQPEDVRAQAVADMLVLYGSVRDALPDHWRAVFADGADTGNVPPRAATADANRSSDTSGDPSSPSTSAGTTGPQDPSAPSRSMEPGSGSTAGMERSTRKNLMGDTSIEDMRPVPRLVNSTSAEDIAEAGQLFDLDTEGLRAALGDLLELDVTTIDGQTWTAAQLLDELDADIAAYRVIDTCMMGRAG